MMRYSLIPTLIFLNIQLIGQVVDCSRTTTLLDGVYQIEGTAYLERFEDGSIQLRLGDDFVTDSGPDVQIFLSNDSTSIAGGVMLADIGFVDGINHFSGEITFDVPADVTIGEYQYLVFRCITFDAYWGGGKWSIPTCEDGGMMPPDTTMNMPMCISTAVATTGWETEVSVCPNDGIPDVVPFLNSIGATPRENYSYLIADANNNLVEIVNETSYDFEGSSFEPQFVFGIFYRGELSFTIGEPISEITADTCVELSSSSLFLTVNKTNCVSTFECVPTITATTNWESEVSICPNDSIPDIIPFINNEGQEPGINYAYIITDSLRNIEKVHLSSAFDFEGSGLGTNHVYGISYSGNLNFIQGEPLESITADSCFILSDTTIFLTVFKNACTGIASRTVSGKICAINGQGINGVTITYGDGLVATTDAQGEYEISGLPVDEELVFEPTYDLNPGNGISSTDLVLTTRHILGISPFPNPLQLLAADANNNGSVSASDLVTMKRVLLGQAPNFPGNTSWRFIDASMEVTPDILVLSTGATIRIAAGPSNQENVNFVGIKIGDVNGNANLNLN